MTNVAGRPKACHQMRCFCTVLLPGRLCSTHAGAAVQVGHLPARCGGGCVPVGACLHGHWPAHLQAAQGLCLQLPAVCSVPVRRLEALRPGHPRLDQQRHCCPVVVLEGQLDEAFCTGGCWVEVAALCALGFALVLALAVACDCCGACDFVAATATKTSEGLSHLLLTAVVPGQGSKRCAYVQLCGNGGTS
jgi:hypothetical protein